MMPTLNTPGVGTAAIVWTLACLGIGIIILLRGDYSHYTWWMVTEFWIVTLLASFGYDHIFAVAFLIQNFLVIIGVVAMSAMQCSMLVSTANELGWLYIPLNFLVHYAPFLIVLGFPPKSQIKTFGQQTVVGISIFVSYALVNNAVHVYGCFFKRGIVPILFTLAALALLGLEKPFVKALTKHNYV